MKQITIKSLSLQNFKGIVQMDKTFAMREEIQAKNGSGKTTLMHAWLWVLGLEVPDVIPKIDNQELHNLETKVTAVVRVEEFEYTLCRTQTEEWKVNRATGENEKHTNKCMYAIDGIEFTFTMYKEKLAMYFGLAYDRIEMLTNKDYFNTDKVPKWTWTSRRKELFELTGTAELLQGLAEKSDYELIADDLRKGFSATDIRRTKMKALKGISDEKDRNATLIADKQNDIAKYGAIDFAALEAQKAGYEQQLTELNLSIVKAEDGTDKAQIQAKINDLLGEQTQLKIADNNRKAHLKNTADGYSIQKRQIQNHAEAMKGKITDIAACEKRIAELQTLTWSGDTKCPTCGQALPTESIQKAKERWAVEIAKEIHLLQHDLERGKESNEAIEKELTALRKQYTALSSEESLALAELDNFEDNPRIVAIDGEIAALREQLSEKPTNTDDDVQAQIYTLNGLLSAIQSKLAYRQVVADLKERVEGLKVANLELTNKEMVLKAAIQQIDAYVSETVRLVTDTINGLFDGGVSFALFSENYAGAESELKETCVCMHNGKVYSSMSGGERFIANLKVTQALQRAYGVSLPLFCDNAECYTDQIEGAQQVIALRAVPNEKLDNCIQVQKR